MSGTPTMSGTPLQFPGWYITLQTAVLNQLPRPGEIDQFTAKRWSDNQASLKANLRECLTPILKFEKVKAFLKLQSGRESLVLDSLDRDDRICDNNELFHGGIDPWFGSRDLDVDYRKASPKTSVRVYQAIKHVDVREIVGSIADDPYRLCLSQGQIVQFVKKYPAWLRKTETYTIFLTRAARSDIALVLVRLIQDKGWNVSFYPYTNPKEARSLMPWEQLVIPRWKGAAS